MIFPNFVSAMEGISRNSESVTDFSGDHFIPTNESEQLISPNRLNSSFPFIHFVSTADIFSAHHSFGTTIHELPNSTNTSSSYPTDFNSIYNSFYSFAPTATRSAPPLTVSNYLWIYLAPVILVIGLVGNILTLIVMRRRRLGGTTTSVYMPSMAVADTIALTAGIIPDWMKACRFPLFVQLGAVACQFEKFVFFSASDLAIWLLVVFTFDRFIAVCFPLRKRAICVPARSRKAVSVTALLAVVKNAHVFWTRGPTAKEVCGRPEPYAYFENSVRPWIAFTLVSAVPFTVLCCCNSLIVYKMIQMRRIRMESCAAAGGRNFSSRTTTGPGGGGGGEGGGAGRGGRGGVNITQTTMMCLSVSFAFLFCVTPSIILLIGKARWSAQSATAYDLFKAVSNLLSYLNHAINFFLYCITGERFRHELCSTLKCHWDREGRWGSGHSSSLPNSGQDESLQGMTSTRTTALSGYSGSGGGRKFTTAAYAVPVSSSRGHGGGNHGVRHALHSVTAHVIVNHEKMVELAEL